MHVRVGCVAPENHYSEDDQAPDVKLRKNTAKKERVTMELSDGDYKLERAPDAVAGYCILRYTPGPPGYVSIVVVKRAGADDPPGRSCCAHSPDEALLPSKPSSETLIDAGN